MPKPSPAKKSRTKKSAKPPVIRSKDKRKVVVKKTKANEPLVRKAALGSRGSLTAPKRAQASHSKRTQSERSSSKLTLKENKPRQPKVNPVRTASLKQYEAAVRLLYSHEYEKAKVAFEKVIAAFADDKGWLMDAYSGDGLHPNAQGYKVMAPIVAAGIQKALP